MTAIAAIWTPDEVVIAADSFETRLEPGKAPVVVPNVCKLHVEGDFAYVARGLAWEDESGLNVYARAKEIVQAGGAFPEVLERLRCRLLEDFRRAVELLGEVSTLDLVVSTIGGGKPKMGSVYVDRDQSRIGYVPNPDFDDPEKEFFLAPNQVAEIAYRPNPCIAQRDLIGRTRHFVQRMIEKFKTQVGPPIRIVRLGDATIQWIE